MNSFNFGRKVEICGDIYYINRDMKKISDAMEGCAKEMFDLARKEGADGRAMEQIQKEAEKAVDVALGNGSFARIFQNEKADMLNMCDLIGFITDEIKLWKAEVAAKGRAGMEIIKNSR